LRFAFTFVFAFTSAFIIYAVGTFTFEITTKHILDIDTLVEISIF